MSNKLRRVLCPTPEEQKEDLKKRLKLWGEAVKEKSCSVCVHFYDDSTGVSTDYGCDLGGDYNDCAISRIGRGECDRWEKTAFK